MKQKTYIIIGVILVILLLAVWLYLLFFGTPKDANDVFNDLGFAGEVDTTGVINPEPLVAEQPVVNMKRPRLRQLTTKPVIGFMEVRQSTTSNPTIHYAESGTGHIYQIDLASGDETRISNATIQEAAIASFSPNGNWVAIKAENDKRINSLSLLNFSTTSTDVSVSPFEKMISDFKIINDQELMYVSASENGQAVRTLNLQSKTDKISVTIPFFETTLDWPMSANDNLYFYPKPTYQLKSFLYASKQGVIQRLPIDGFGLTVLTSPKYIIYNYISNNFVNSTVFNKGTGSSTPGSIPMLNEKCVIMATSSLAWCGHQSGLKGADFPDTWYRGTTSFIDDLWQVNLDDMSAVRLVDTLHESGREIDITNMTTGVSETALYFINKNDNTLWMYEL